MLDTKSLDQPIHAIQHLADQLFPPQIGAGLCSAADNIAPQIHQQHGNAACRQFNTDGEVLHRHKIQIFRVSAHYMTAPNLLVKYRVADQFRGDVGHGSPAKLCGLLNTSARGAAMLTDSHLLLWVFESV